MCEGSKIYLYDCAVVNSILFFLLTDVDECFMAALDSSVICLQPNTQCVNTNGSFECACVDGYEVLDGQCQRERLLCLTD